ncbi:MAG: hypothetical protein JRG91_20420, partial [Deltaproteobacteria bacterium]|nr:hypothetical protein [Deltaproteobacteria bacterium]
LQLIDGCKKSVKIPVIASLNASRPGTWTKFAAQVEAAGADAIELNIYVMPMDPARPSEDIEQTYFDILESVLEQVKIPVAVKIGPFFSNISRMVLELDRRGAAGIVMFNRFFQPDLDIEKMKNRMKVTLSEPHEMQLPLRWIAPLSDDTKCDLCASTGVHDFRGALKQILAGASAVQLCSALYRNKRTYIGKVASEMNAWGREEPRVRQGHPRTPQRGEEPQSRAARPVSVHQGSGGGGLTGRRATRSSFPSSFPSSRPCPSSSCPSCRPRPRPRPSRPRASRPSSSGPRSSRGAAGRPPR